MKKLLNLYAGVGGNRKGIPAGFAVTALEYDPKIAAVYKKLYPEDEVIVGDAHQYLLDNYKKYEFCWASPPCPSHSKMNQSGRNRTPRYPDMGLYQEIIFLKHNFKGLWAVENVVPYYTPLIEPSVRLGRHLFWSNFHISQAPMPKFKGFIKKQNLEAKKELHEWLGIYFDEVLYVGKNHCPTQVLRNCVHPDTAKHIMGCALAEPKNNQLEMLQYEAAEEA
tara:strand:- start:1099 stop:1764 length:666 start_codon:yes stop_codon:yes gene_type:complete